MNNGYIQTAREAFQMIIDAKDMLPSQALAAMAQVGLKNLDAALDSLKQAQPQESGEDAIKLLHDLANYCFEPDGITPELIAHKDFFAARMEEIEREKEQLHARYKAFTAAPSQSQGDSKPMEQEPDINVLRSERTGRFPYDIELRICEKTDPEFAARMKKARAELRADIEASMNDVATPQPIDSGMEVIEAEIKHIACVVGIIGSPKIMEFAKAIIGRFCRCSAAEHGKQSCNTCGGTGDVVPGEPDACGVCDGSGVEPAPVDAPMQPDAYNRKLRQQLEQEWADLQKLKSNYTAPPATPARDDVLTDAELADPEYMRGYVGELKAMVDEMMAGRDDVLEEAAKAWWHKYGYDQGGVAEWLRTLKSAS